MSEGLYKGTNVIFSMKMETVAHDELSVAERSYQSSCEVAFDHTIDYDCSIIGKEGLQQGDNLSENEQYVNEP